MNHKQLSKFLSLVLRHKPEIIGITLDKEGWTDVSQLLSAIQQQKPHWRSLTVATIQQMMANSNKQRFELKGNQIRAYYGHSINQKIEKTITTPPEILYHGTARKTVSLIMESGLKPMSRQYVHLSGDLDTAIMVGKRRDCQPTILRVHALAAFKSGIAFYQEKNGIWLSEPIPPKYIY